MSIRIKLQTNLKQLLLGNMVLKLKAIKNKIKKIIFMVRRMLIIFSIDFKKMMMYKMIINMIITINKILWIIRILLRPMKSSYCNSKFKIKMTRRITYNNISKIINMLKIMQFGVRIRQLKPNLKRKLMIVIMKIMIWSLCNKCPNIVLIATTNYIRI